MRRLLAAAVPVAACLCATTGTADAAAPEFAAAVSMRATAPAVVAGWDGWRIGDAVAVVCEDLHRHAGDARVIADTVTTYGVTVAAARAVALHARAAGCPDYPRPFTYR